MAQLSPTSALHHPAYANVVLDLEPTVKGVCETTSTNGSRCNIAYEIHGTGPKRLLWVGGLGNMKWFWQRQTLDFGHFNAEEYSCLIFDNRGMGESGRPLAKYTMREFVSDIIQLLDKVGWTKERQVHVIGSSMGGMICQELAATIPIRIASLTLVSTAPGIKDSLGFIESLTRQANILLHNLLGMQFPAMKYLLFSDTWTVQPDAALDPEADDSTFPTNGDRWTAETTYLFHDPGYSGLGWLLQTLSILGWSKSKEDLKALADGLGRGRIQCIHGSDDRAIPVERNYELVAGLGGSRGNESKVRNTIFDGCGHIPPMERRKEFAKLVKELVEETEVMRDE